ncbi:MAG TPA: LEA type 2 family protein [Gammaproteobacteria bacterium]|nr:LEA type 2 family protein [Gammaproteobacteria bacterium]
MKGTGKRDARIRKIFAALMLVGAVSLSLLSCSSVPRRLAQPQANLLDLNVLESRPEGQLFAFRLQLVNPNEAEIPVVRLDFDIRLDGEGRLIGQHDTAFTLPARGSEIVNVEVFSALVSSASRLMAFSEGPENVLTYEFHGELVLEATLREPLALFRRGQIPLTVAAEAR